MLPVLASNQRPHVCIASAVTFYSSILGLALFYLFNSFSSELPWGSQCKESDDICKATPKRALPIQASTHFYEQTLHTDQSSWEEGLAQTASAPLFGSVLSFMPVLVNKGSLFRPALVHLWHHTPAAKECGCMSAACVLDSSCQT